MVADLVSIITPCYGTAKYLPKLLHSILTQKYPRIEVFVIDDGSPDDIKSVTAQFEKSYRDKGYDLEYVWQTNGGQSVAIQNGLNRIRGEFLVWPDSDDFYASDETISKMVARFKLSGSDVGMVRTQEVVVRDDGFYTPFSLLGKKAKNEESRSLFDDCLLGKNGFYFCPGAYMVRTDALRSSTQLPIYTEKDAGQNWQLMLPVLYNYKCSTILEPLYNVVERLTSHSRAKKTYEKSRQRIETYRRTIIGTLERINNMSAEDLGRYKKMVESRYLQIHLNDALNHENQQDSNSLIKKMKALNLRIDSRTVLKYYLMRTGLLRLIRKFRQSIHHI